MTSKEIEGDNLEFIQVSHDSAWQRQANASTETSASDHIIE